MHMDKWVRRGQALWCLHKEKITYLIFGGLTTLVNYAVYLLCSRVFWQSTSVSTNAAWLVSVLFAFVTNKVWVFESKATGTKALLREFGAFVSARVLSGLMNWGIMVLGVDVLRFWDILVLLFSNVLVIVFNYFASKWFIFKKIEETEGDEGNGRETEQNDL